jgi:hypothetical protein
MIRAFFVRQLRSKTPAVIPTVINIDCKSYILFEYSILANGRLCSCKRPGMCSTVLRLTTWSNIHVPISCLSCHPWIDINADATYVVRRTDVWASEVPPAVSSSSSFILYVIRMERFGDKHPEERGLTCPNASQIMHHHDHTMTLTTSLLNRFRICY